MLEPKQPETEIEHSDVEEIAISTEPISKNNDDQKGSEIDEELLSGAGSEEIEEEEEETEEEEHSSESQNYDSESSVDDSDLLKRLDEKYGKLPAHSDEDEPESDDIEDDDDEDIDPTWTST